MMKDPLNKTVMEEIGLTVDDYGRIMDQDSRQQLLYKNHNMKYSSSNSVTLTNQDIIFDPISHRDMMGSLFNHFVSKIEEEDDVYIPNYYEINSEDGTALEAKVGNEKITTNYYYNDSLKYLDMIQRLNGSENIDLKQYDSAPIIKKKVTKTRKKKGIFKD